MYMIAEVSQYVAVASFAEAWIEIAICGAIKEGTLVASFAEAWIEIPTFHRLLKRPFGRLLRGGVD